MDVGTAAGAGKIRVAIGAGGTEGCVGAAPAAAETPYFFASAGEYTVVAGESGTKAHGFSIVSVNIANAYPAPTATSKMDDRTMTVTNRLKTGPVALDVRWSA